MSVASSQYVLLGSSFLLSPASMLHRLHAIYCVHCSAYSPVVNECSNVLQAKEDSKAPAKEDSQAKAGQEESKK